MKPDGHMTRMPLLRELVRTIAVTSGKGGVGKTSVVVNLAVALAELDLRVTLLDADYGLGNVDILLGLDPGRTLEQVLRGTASLADVLVDGPRGVRILPASTGAQDLTSLTNEQQGRLQLALGELAGSTDVLLVDTASGISDNVVTWLSAAGEVVIVTSPDPTAIVDAYAVLKLIDRLDPGKAAALLVNNVSDAREAREVHARLETASTGFLGCELAFLGHVVRDPLLAEAARQREPLVRLVPKSPASRCFRRIARRLAGGPFRTAAQAETRDAEALETVAP